MEVDTKTFVRYILENALAFTWTLQGFGMLRTYIGHSHRLHIWDSRYSVPNVSDIHTHPWNFDSTVVAGRMINLRYERRNDNSNSHMEQIIKCGEGGGLCGVPKREYLVCSGSESLSEGESYHQEAHEIHRSIPESGTVTLVKRTVKSDPDHASVFWPLGQSWVSAEPRPATAEEITDICGFARSRWF